MIDAKQLLSECQALVRELEADLRDELDEHPELEAALRREHHEATVAKRTRRPAEEWTAERITQAAVAWVLGCVFARFLEDNALVDTPRLSGTGVRLQRARDEETLYFRQYPESTAREYLEDTFRAVAALPGCSGLFDERHNPIWQLPISGDAARTLLEQWREINPQSGVLVHDFTDPAWGTRFLGDLYQDLSETARKQYALLQTPEFIEEFILERTLEPAIGEFGLETVTLIDPACGSGHFLLGAFQRLFGHWREVEPGEDARVHVERVLDALAGVDLNPFAAAIARFRLLIAASRACGVGSLRNAPNFRIEIAVGDSLLHTPRRDRLDVGPAGIRRGIEHVYATEDHDDLRRILERQYHAVVANPPYITPKDAALNQAYRDRFGSCHRAYALSVPFMELLFELAVPQEGSNRSAGFVGQITSNSFMKREFGKKLIEDFLVRMDITAIIDTSGVYIPGHGTPTVILVGRNRPPVAPKVRVVMGIRAERSRPADPAQGSVWIAIMASLDQPGSQNEFVSVDDVERSTFGNHPWAIGGGGAAELRTRLGRDKQILADLIADFGRTTHTGEDAGFFMSEKAARTHQLAPFVPLIEGDVVRDWGIAPEAVALFPYSLPQGLPLDPPIELARHFWLLRSALRGRRDFGQTPEERGLRWFDWSMFFRNRFTSAMSVVVAFVSTHNHFALWRGPIVSKQSAPAITLPPSSSEDDYLGLLGLLNSSTLAFWFKQTLMDRGGGGIGGGLATESWERFFEHDAAKVSKVPIAAERPVLLARKLDELAVNLLSLRPAELARTPEAMASGRRRSGAVQGQLVALQEELDWRVYGLYGLIEEDLTLPDYGVPELRLGQRAFEIMLARRIAAGEEETTWFERHGSTPSTELPAHWPEDYRKLVERRIEVIETNRDVALIEQPEYKRRWQWEPWDKQEKRALREWLLDRLEGGQHWQRLQLTSCARLADEARKDPEFRSVAEQYAGRGDVDLTKLVETLVIEEAVPYLAAWRYTDDGMRVRAAWERTWELQRREDAIDALCTVSEDDPHRLTLEQAKARKQVEVGQVPVPPKYTSKHFRKATYWQLRGKLDVSKERFIHYPGCERAADPSPVIGWAGWNHLQRSQALAQYVTRMRQEERWEADRLAPLLTGLAEQLPWVMQWHNEFDASLGRRFGDAYADFLSGQLAELGLSPEDIAAWRPPEASRGRRARRVAV